MRGQRRLLPHRPFSSRIRHQSHTSASADMVSVLSQIETDHLEMIHDAQMDFYGTRVATCSTDKTIRIYSTASGTHSLEATLLGHEEPVWQVSWAHPSFGNILASCSYDRKVLIWKEEKPTVWKKIYEYARHESSVNSISWAPKEFGLILTAGSSDGSISILTCRDGNWEDKKILKAHAIGVNAVCWRPSTAPSTTGLSGTQAVLAKEDSKIRRFVSAGCDNVLKIWKFLEDEDKWVEEHKLEGHSDWVHDVAWSSSVGLPKNYIASCGRDNRVIIWSKDTATGKWTSKVLHVFDDTAWHVSWALMGNLLSVSVGENKTSIWKETLSGKWICVSDQQH